MKGTTVVFMIGLAILLWPWNAQASGSRVYVGVGVGTAIAIGSGIVSFNIGYNQQVSKEKPESPLSEMDRPPALAGLKRQGEETVPNVFPDLTLHAPSLPSPTLRFELPFFILRW